MPEIISYILSLSGLLSMVIASLIKGKDMRKILILVFLGNALVATSYLLDGNYNGAASCYIGAAQTIINYFFESKNKKLPVWLIVLYAAAFIIVNAVVIADWRGLVAIIASLTFIMCIGQKSGGRYRFWTLVNMVLWCTYDLITFTYQALITHVVMLTSTVVGMILHDVKNKKA